LKDLGFLVRSIRVSEKPRHPERFANLKAELLGLRERFEAGDVDGLKDASGADFEQRRALQRRLRPGFRSPHRTRERA
jgi:hypothetical protein